MDKIWDSGYRQITSSSKPINSAADLSGFKIRVPISPLWTSMFKSFGAAPTGINFGEVYSALQTKIVDGQDTSLVSIDSAKLYEIQKYCSVTNHMWDGYWCLANTRAFERMPGDLQEIVARNINQAAMDQRKENLRLNQSLQVELEKGLVFNKPDPASFRAALTNAGFYTEWREKFGAEAGNCSRNIRRTRLMSDGVVELSADLVNRSAAGIESILVRGDLVLSLVTEIPAAILIVVEIGLLFTGVVTGVMCFIVRSLDGRMNWLPSCS